MVPFPGDHCLFLRLRGYEKHQHISLPAQEGCARPASAASTSSHSLPAAAATIRGGRGVPVVRD